MSVKMSFFVLQCIVFCTFLLTVSVESRYFGQEQQSSAQVGQESQSQSNNDFNQNQQSNGDLEDTNADVLLGQGQEQELGQQLAKDTEKYEQELSYVAEKGGHKGTFTEKDAQIVESKNKDKPWYQRLRSWTGKKLQQLGTSIKGSGYKRDADYYGGYDLY